MAEQVAKLTYVIDVQNDTQKGVEKLNKQFEGMQRTLGNIAKAAVTFLGTKKMIEFGREAIKISDNLRLASTAFKNFNQLSSVEFEESMERMRKAASGTLTDLELLQKANLAKMFKIQTPIEKMIELSRKQARIMGQDVEFIFNSVVTGIGRKSKMILDNFGVIMDTTTAEKQLAEDLGKTVDELTDKEKDRAFELAAIKGLQESVTKSGIKNFETFEDKIARVNVKFTTLKGKIGELISPKVLKIYTFWAEKMEDIVTIAERAENLDKIRSKKGVELRTRLNALIEKRLKTQEDLNFQMRANLLLTQKQREIANKIVKNEKIMLGFNEAQKKAIKLIAVKQNEVLSLKEQEKKIGLELAREEGTFKKRSIEKIINKQKLINLDKKRAQNLRKLAKEEEERKIKEKNDLLEKKRKQKQEDDENKKRDKQLIQFNKMKQKAIIDNIEDEEQRIIKKSELEIELAKKKFSLLSQKQLDVVENILLKKRDEAIKALPGSDPTELEIAKENLRKFWTETEDIAIQGYTSLTNMSTTFSNAFQDQAKMFITTGKTSNKEFRKILQDQVAIEASAIASKSMINSLFELGKGFAMMFVNPAEAATHFKSAAIFKSVGTAVAAIAGGRAISQMLGGSSLQESGSGADTSALTDRNVGTERIQEITKRNKIVIEVNNSNVVGENGMQQFAEIIRDNIQTNNEVNDTQIVFQ